MRAAWRVQAFLGHTQPLDWPAGNQVLGDNLRRIPWLDVAVPDRFGIDHHHRAVLALVQAAGFVDAHVAAEACRLHLLLQLGVQAAASVARTGAPRRALGPRVAADKDMTLKCGQTDFLLIQVCIQTNATAPVRELSTIAPRQPALVCENKSLTMNMDNLLPLKDDMVAFIEGHGLKRLPGYVTDDIPSIVWEGSGNPDAWKDFVEMAKYAGAPFVTFSEMTLEREEIDALIDEAGEMNFPDEETAELVEAQWLRKYAGNLGYIQLGFVYQGVAFLHETTTEWYERFQGLLEDIETFQEIVIGDQEHDHEDEDE